MPISSTTKPQPLRVLHKSVAALAVAGAGAFSTLFSAHAQDAGPLIDILVRKGLITSKEGDEVRAELSKEFSTRTSAAKLKLSESVKELKLYGDLRLRYQYDNRDIQTDPDSVGARSAGFDKDRSRMALT